MAFDFPSSPTPGQIFTPPGGPSYIWQSPVWKVMSGLLPSPTADTRNRIVNGAMQISQENGNGAVTTANIYTVDQFQTGGNWAGAYSAQRVQLATPNGSTDRLRMTVTTGAAMAAANAVNMQLPIEGLKVPDFMWGGANARQVVLRFGWKSPAGNYAISIRNGTTADRSYIAPFTISAAQAGTDTVQTFVIPGDTTGTWATDNSKALSVTFTIATGTTLQGVAGWQAGTFIGVATTAAATTTSAVFELFDVGLYLDPQATGLPPPWQEPDYAAELAACMRYFQQTGNLNQSWTATAAGQFAYNSYPFFVPMRIAPTVTVPAAGTGTNVASYLQDQVTAWGIGRIGTSATATGAVSFVNRVLYMNARM